MASEKKKVAANFQAPSEKIIGLFDEFSTFSGRVRGRVVIAPFSIIKRFEIILIVPY